MPFTITLTRGEEYHRAVTAASAGSAGEIIIDLDDQTGGFETKLEAIEGLKKAIQVLEQNDYPPA